MLIHSLAVITVLGFAYGASRQYRRSYFMQNARHDLLQSIAAVQPRDNELYVMWAPGFPYQAISPFDNLMSFSNLHQLVVGWPQHTPIYQAMKQRFAIDDVSALYFNALTSFSSVRLGVMPSIKDTSKNTTASTSASWSGMPAGTLTTSLVILNRAGTVFPVTTNQPLLSTKR